MNISHNKQYMLQYIKRKIEKGEEAQGPCIFKEEAMIYLTLYNKNLGSTSSSNHTSYRLYIQTASVKLNHSQ